MCIIIPVGCGRPITPDNGSIETYRNITEGAEIFFKCNPGFVPAGRMRAVCASDGRWSPDPATLVCTGEILIFKCRLSVDSLTVGMAPMRNICNT